MLAAKFPHFPVFFPANVPKKDFHDFDAGAGPPVRTSSVLRQNFAGGGHWVLFWYVSGRSLLFIFICSQVDVILIKCVQFYHWWAIVSVRFYPDHHCCRRCPMFLQPIAIFSQKLEGLRGHLGCVQVRSLSDKQRVDLKLRIGRLHLNSGGKKTKA